MSSFSVSQDPYPVSGTSRRRSQFTYRQLGMLASYSASSPLRVIAHIDLDAFYAQCEMVRLGTVEDQPLAVQQWQGLIAVNYPARSFGISRHCTVTEAKKLCPQLTAQHVATWKEGEEKWAYHNDAASHIDTHKVSLDPYRLQSRKILALIKECLPANQQKVEKASIDEVFLDLSAQVHSIVLSRFPELLSPAPYDDQTEKLPLPSVSVLNWPADALALNNGDAEEGDPDWDDVMLLIGSEIVRDIRAQVRQKLGYTCSAGIAGNKMLSKLGSGHKKPDQQTIIRNRAISAFLSSMKFTKIRNLGGKLGDQVAMAYGTEAVKDLLTIPVEQLKCKFGDDTGVWLFQIIRGIDFSEVNSRTQIKSMLSAKSFRPSISTQEQAVRWLRILVADIFSRLVEEGVLENKRRPKTMNLHHRRGGQARSRQCGIAPGRAVDEASLFGLAKSLLDQIILEGRVWPCTNLSLCVGGFEDGVTGNKGIGSYLLKGEEARKFNSLCRRDETERDTGEPPGKRRRLDNPRTPDFFLDKGFSPAEEGAQEGDTAEEGTQEGDRADCCETETRNLTTANQVEGKMEKLPLDESKAEIAAVGCICSRCKMGFHDNQDFQNHLDWHLAKDLQDQECCTGQMANQPSALCGTTKSNQKGNLALSRKSSKKVKKLEQGQSTLNFQ